MRGRPSGLPFRQATRRRSPAQPVTGSGYATTAPGRGSPWRPRSTLETGSSPSGTSPRVGCPGHCTLYSGYGAGHHHDGARSYPRPRQFPGGLSGPGILKASLHGLGDVHPRRTKRILRHVLRDDGDYPFARHSLGGRTCSGSLVLLGGYSVSRAGAGDAS